MCIRDSTTIVQRSSLTHNREQISGVASLSYGYFGAGKHPGTNTTTVERIDFANDTLISVVRGPLATSTGNAAATGTKDYGYFGGGVEPGTPITTVQRIDYVNDTATAVEKGPLTQGRALLGATGNTNHGYWMGGWGTPSPSPAKRSTVDRIDYSSDTTATVAKGSLTAVKYGVGSTGNENFGYCAGGHPGPYSTVERVDYSNDTATALAKGPLAAAMRYMSVTGNSSHGYWCEGHPGPISTINRIDYDNDTASISRGNGPNLYYAAGLSAAANALASNFIGTASNTGVNRVPVGTDYGYMGGNYPDGTTVDRIDYSNDTATAAVKGPLNLGRGFMGGTGNLSYGYWGGGGVHPSPTYSAVDRMDYSNDTTTASPKGPLSVSTGFGVAATGNQDFGYFGGGYSSRTTVSRVDYASDTATALRRGDLSPSFSPAWGISATGNQDFGYFGGGNPDSPISTICRIDYSNDTPTASAKGPLATARAYLSLIHI